MTCFMDPEVGGSGVKGSPAVSQPQCTLPYDFVSWQRVSTLNLLILLWQLVLCYCMASFIEGSRIVCLPQVHRSLVDRGEIFSALAWRLDRGLEYERRASFDSTIFPRGLLHFQVTVELRSWTIQV